MRVSALKKDMAYHYEDIKALFVEARDGIQTVGVGLGDIGVSHSRYFVYILVIIAENI